MRASPMYFTVSGTGPGIAGAGSSGDVLREYGPDVVHSNDLPTHQIVGDAARGLGMPRICHHRFPFEGPAVDWLNKAGAEGTCSSRGR